jgi:hypothetical protein
MPTIQLTTTEKRGDIADRELKKNEKEKIVAGVHPLGNMPPFNDSVRGVLSV